MILNVNLISNIGFGPGATHTTGAGELANLTVQAMHFPLRHPAHVAVCRALDRRYFNAYCRKPLLRRAVNKLRRILGESRG